MGDAPPSARKAAARRAYMQQQQQSFDHDAGSAATGLFGAGEGGDSEFGVLVARYMDGIVSVAVSCGPSGITPPSPGRWGGDGGVRIAGGAALYGGRVCAGPGTCADVCVPHPSLPPSPPAAPLH